MEVALAASHHAGSLHAIADLKSSQISALIHMQVLFGFGEKVQQKVQELKGNVEQAAAQKDDAAERVVAESPGTSQEDNAEKVRREAGEHFAMFSQCFRSFVAAGPEALDGYR
jgi:hypothetical protein